MKMDRLIGILSVLLQKEKTTAPELAERFEVSKRTINRDIETLCKAGIPIVTTQGVGGGISIIEGYSMDKTLLTSKDMQMIMAGLRSLDSISGSQYYSQLMEKIKVGSSEFAKGTDSILIDLATWHKESTTEKVSLIQDAIELKKRLSFHYYAPRGESNREMEPYYLIYKWSNWYVYGWCLLRREYRLFKISRMDRLKHSDAFEARDNVPMPEFDDKRIFPGEHRLKAEFDASMKWYLIEQFGVDSFTMQSDGKLLLECEYHDVEGLISWMLTCRDKVTVLEPQSVREELRRITSEIAERYRNDK